MDGARLRIFFDEGRSKPPVFQVTRARLDAALARRPEVADRLDVVLADQGEAFGPGIAGWDAAVGFRFPTALIREKAARLRWLHAIGAGVEHLLPFDWLPDGAVLTNNRGVHTEKSTESAMLFILALNTQLPAIATNQREARWKPIFSSCVRGRTLLVVGLGGMGTAAIRAGRTLGMKVVGVRRSGGSHPELGEVHRTDALDALLPQADIVFITAPLTPETRHMIDARRLGLMKQGAGLVNFGRARVVDYDALQAALRNGHLSGAILDVFDPEPLPSDSPLWSCPNLIMTPHVTSDDEEGYMPKTLDLVMENAARLLDGRPLENLVRAELGY